MWRGADQAHAELTQSCPALLQRQRVPLRPLSRRAVALEDGDAHAALLQRQRESAA